MEHNEHNEHNEHGEPNTGDHGDQGNGGHGGDEGHGGAGSGGHGGHGNDGHGGHGGGHGGGGGHHHPPGSSYGAWTTKEEADPMVARNSGPASSFDVDLSLLKQYINQAATANMMRVMIGMTEDGQYKLVIEMMDIVGSFATPIYYSMPSAVGVEYVLEHIDPTNPPPNCC